ncbi:MAG: oxygen-independent coproporphyrinogen III oxidase [Pedobacter sp.]|nr:MAG: oxygen-independent coproporphyrinogen III oxidase [Pedobacter sp.]
MDISQLADKYRVAAPRYTSYPTVPYWDGSNFDEAQWTERLISSYKASPEGLSIYIHLPFCESLCTYCGCNTRITKNHGVERPYIATVLKEWKLYVDILGTRPVIKEIHLGGGTPTFFSPDNLELLINGITRLAELHKHAEFSFEAHPNNTTEEHLKTLYNLGFKRLSLGIQDFDPVVQLVINRIQPVEAVENVTRMAREIGYSSINYDLIYGLPLQSSEGLTSTLNTVIRLNPDRIAFYSYAHVPWVKPGQRRYTEAHLPSAELKNQLYETGRGLLVEAGYAEIGMDHFTLTTDSLYQAEMNGTLHRNFMGYTGQQSEVMIGLGVSSISDCWTAFAQNVKTVEEYMRIVDAGRLPVFKGHILTDTDLVIRKHILNIMCRGCTSWFFPEERDENFVPGIQRMKSLADDGLVVLNNYDLKVTSLGKRFLRNICMALDARLWADKPATQLFSMAD